MRASDGGDKGARRVGKNFIMEKFAKATAPFNAIPSQLAHHGKKIKYSSLGEGERFSCYGDALAWISESMFGSLCYGAKEPSLFDGFSPKRAK